MSNSRLRALRASTLFVVGILLFAVVHAFTSRKPDSGAPGPSRPQEETEQPYEDLARHYDAVRTDAVTSADPETNALLAHLLRPTAIHYQPAARSVYLGELRVRDLDPDGRVILEDLGERRPYEGVRCGADCLKVELLVEDGPVTLHLPVPPGERVDVESVRLDGAQVPVYAASADEPVIALPQRVRALLSYRTGPGPSHFLPPAQGRTLPEPLTQQLRAWRSRPREEIVLRATAYVRKAIHYTHDPDEATPKPRIDNESFLSRTTRAGAGDGDVQNGVLMLILQELGIPARMSVGFDGHEGRVGGLMHAWVEYQREDGTLGTTDASVQPTSPGSLPELPAEKPGADAGHESAR